NDLYARQLLCSLRKKIMIRKERVRSGPFRQPTQQPADRSKSSSWRSITRTLSKALPLGLLLAATSPVSAQDTVEWTHLGGDVHHTRYTPADKITPENFTQLKEAWVWDGASLDAASGRSTPSYVNGKLYTVAGPRRHVVAMDPKTGETLWSYREPNTYRWEYSMRQDYGKGVAYAEVDGKGVIYIISPAFILTALDADTVAPLEGFGEPVPIEGFAQTGVVDLLAHM